MDKKEREKGLLLLELLKAVDSMKELTNVMQRGFDDQDRKFDELVKAFDDQGRKFDGFAKAIGESK